MSDELKGIPIISDCPKKVGRFGETPSDKTLAFIHQLKPDVIVRFAYGILKGEILRSAKYGVWSFHHGDPSQFRGQPPGFWEMFEGRTSVGAILQVLSEELDAGRILHHGKFKVSPQSYAKTRDTLYFGSAPWLARTCADIRFNGWERVRQRHSAIKSDGPIYRQPTNRETARFGAKIAKNHLRIQFDYKLHRQQWSCAVIDRPIGEVAGLKGLEKQTKALQSAHWMKPRPDEFYADPFGLSTFGDTITLFFERYYWTQQKGVISRVTFEATEFGPVQDCIVTDFHQSYPFVYQGDGDAILLPEQAESGSLTGYRLSRSAEPLAPVPIAMGGDLLDVTLHRQGEKLWAFALREGKTQNTELHLFHSDSIEADWYPHPLNPVKSDITSARPGGTLFLHEGKLYRPAQDCASHYGSAISINEIVTLTETDFEERVIGKIEPLTETCRSYGLHTLSAVGDRTLIDGAQKEFRVVGSQ